MTYMHPDWVSVVFGVVIVGDSGRVLAGNRRRGASWFEPRGFRTPVLWLVVGFAILIVGLLNLWA